MTLSGLGDNAIEQGRPASKGPWRLGVFEQIWVWCEHCPLMAPYDEIEDTLPVVAGDLLAIGHFTGNHWRKIFNVYAKSVFSIYQGQASTWQQYRDNELLQKNSGTRLIWQSRDFLGGPPQVLHWVMGKQYASQLGLEPRSGTRRVNNDFAVNHELNCVITPYFDYRQLSNIKMEQLVQLIRDEWPCG